MREKRAKLNEKGRWTNAEAANERPLFFFFVGDEDEGEEREDRRGWVVDEGGVGDSLSVFEVVGGMEEVVAPTDAPAPCFLPKMRDRCTHPHATSPSSCGRLVFEFASKETGTPTSMKRCHRSL